MVENRAKPRKKTTFTRKGHHRAKTVLVCVLIGVLLAAPIPFANTIIGYLPLAAYLFALALSWGYLRLLWRNLQFDQGGVGGGCLRGDQLAFEFTVKNQSIMPAVSLDVSFFISDLFGEERESAKRVVSLPPRSSKTFDFAVRFDHIGTYGVGIRKIDATDPFGVFHRVRVFDELREVAVQPRVFDVAELEISTEASKESSRALTTVIDDGMDYCGVREYRWGDPIKSIHWKLSARIPEGDYFTRLYETSRNPGMAVFIDCDAPDAFTSEQLMDVYDGIVEASLSIEAWGSSLAFETELLFVDATGRRRRFAGPLSERYGDVLERLPRISPGDSRSVLDMVRAESVSVYAQDNLCVCTSNVTDELVGELIRVKTGHHTPILIAVEPRDIEDEQRKRADSRIARLAAARIACVTIQDAEELERGVER